MRYHFSSNENVDEQLVWAFTYFFFGNNGQIKNSFGRVWNEINNKRMVIAEGSLDLSNWPLYNGYVDLHVEWNINKITNSNMVFHS